MEQPPASVRLLGDGVTTATGESTQAPVGTAAPDEDRIRAVLHARAVALSRRQDDGAARRADTIDVLEFGLAEERYAIETRFVQEVQVLRNLTELPCTPAFIAGVVNLRGQVLAVIDLRQFFHLPEKGSSALQRIVVVGKVESEFGLLVDRSAGVYPIASSALQPPLPTASGIGTRHVRGITAESLVVLDMDAILADPSLLVDEAADGMPGAHDNMITTGDETK